MWDTGCPAHMPVNTSSEMRRCCKNRRFLFCCLRLGEHMKKNSADTSLNKFWYSIKVKIVNFDLMVTLMYSWTRFPWRCLSHARVVSSSINSLNDWQHAAQMKTGLCSIWGSRRNNQHVIRESVETWAGCAQAVPDITSAARRAARGRAAEVNN